MTPPTVPTTATAPPVEVVAAEPEPESEPPVAWAELAAGAGWDETHEQTFWAAVMTPTTFLAPQAEMTQFWPAAWMADDWLEEHWQAKSVAPQLTLETAERRQLLAHLGILRAAGPQAEAMLSPPEPDEPEPEGAAVVAGALAPPADFWQSHTALAEAMTSPTLEPQDAATQPAARPWMAALFLASHWQPKSVRPQLCLAAADEIQPVAQEGTLRATLTHWAPASPESPPVGAGAAAAVPVVSPAGVDLGAKRPVWWAEAHTQTALAEASTAPTWSPHFSATQPAA